MGTRIFTIIVMCAFAFVGQAQNKNVFTRNGQNVVYEYMRLGYDSKQRTLVYPQDLEDLCYPFMGASYCRPTGDVGSPKAVVKEVASQFPADSLPKELDVYVYFNLQGQVIALTIRYEKWEIASPEFMDALTKAFQQKIRLTGVTVYKKKPEDYELKGLHLIYRCPTR